MSITDNQTSEQKELNLAVVNACLNRCLGTLMYIVRQFGIKDKKTGRMLLLFAECPNIIIWVMKYFELNAQDIRDCAHGLPIQRAIRQGELILIKHLVENYGLAIDDVRGWETIRSSAVTGKHQHVVEWLEKRFNFEAPEIIWLPKQLAALRQVHALTAQVNVFKNLFVSSQINNL